MILRIGSMFFNKEKRKYGNSVRTNMRHSANLCYISAVKTSYYNF